MARHEQPAYLEIRNWRAYQHYSNRRPQWIKFYAKTIENDSFRALTEHGKLVALLLLCVAANRENRIPNDPQYLSIETGVKRSTIRKAITELLADGYLIASKPASEPASTTASKPASNIASPEVEEDVYPPIVPPQISPVINESPQATPPTLPPYRTYIPPPTISRKPYGYHDHDCICECGCRCRSVLDLWGHLTTIHRDDPEPSAWVRAELERQRQHEAAA